MNRGMPVFARRFREWEIKTPALSHKPRQGQGTRIGIKPAKGWASPQGTRIGIKPAKGWASPRQHKKRDPAYIGHSRPRINN
jgi:hypothetical protein